MKIFLLQFVAVCVAIFLVMTFFVKLGEKVSQPPVHVQRCIRSHSEPDYAMGFLFGPQRVCDEWR
jgi:hypothetical protein